MSYIRPKYRALIQTHNFDDYASKGSVVHPAKKYNRAIEGRSDGVGGGVVIDGECFCVICFPPTSEICDTLIIVECRG